MTAAEKQALKALEKAAAALNYEMTALKPHDAARLEDVLAQVIAHGRLTAEALHLDRQRMTKRVNQILGEAML